VKSNIVKSFKDEKVLLVGDVILDVYIYCTPIGQALYAAVPEVEENRSQVSFGGNGLVAKNILELGGNLTFVSVIGDDDDAKHYDSLIHPKLKKFFFIDKTRKTTVKRRWYIGEKALLQANQVDNHDINKNLEQKITRLLEKEVRKTDVIVVMDPQHGLLTKNLIKNILKLSKKHKKPLYIDAQISHRKSNHHLYKGADTFFLNLKEARAVYPKFNTKEADKSLGVIAKKLKANNIVVKLGEKGSMALFGGECIRNRAHKVNTVDVCGAGDAFLAAICLGDKNKPQDCLSVANIWGALSTTIHGTLPPKRKELLKVLRD